MPKHTGASTLSNAAAHAINLLLSRERALHVPFAVAPVTTLAQYRHHFEEDQYRELLMHHETVAALARSRANVTATTRSLPGALSAGAKEALEAERHANTHFLLELGASPIQTLTRLRQAMTPEDYQRVFAPAAEPLVHFPATAHGLVGLDLGPEFTESFLSAHQTAPQPITGVPSQFEETQIGTNTAETAVAFSPGSLSWLGPHSWRYIPARALVISNILQIAQTVDGVTWKVCGANGNLDPVSTSVDTNCQTIPTFAGQLQWRGDPVVAASADGAVVVMAQQADPIPNFPGLETSAQIGLILATVSFDGGRTFSFTEHVNAKGCANGTQDQPAIAFDRVTGAVWIAFRHAGVSSGSSGVCIRGGVPNAELNRIDWFSDSIDVQHLQHPFAGSPGGILISAIGDVLTIMYQYAPVDVISCSNLVTHWVTGAYGFASTIDMQWYSLSSFDRGTTWQQSNPIWSTNQFPVCSIGTAYQTINRSFGFTRDVDNDLWAAVQDSPYAIQVLWSGDEGLNWSPVVRYEHPGVYLPTLAADALGHVALAYYAGDDSTNKTATYRFNARRRGFAKTDPNAWSTTSEHIGSNFLTSDQGSPLVGGVRWLGDYNGMAPIPPGELGHSSARFLLAWAKRLPDGLGNFQNGTGPLFAAFASAY